MLLSPLFFFIVCHNPSNFTSDTLQEFNDQNQTFPLDKTRLRKSKVPTDTFQLLHSL